MSIIFDYKCESCKLKTGCLYFDKITKKWYCKTHSPYFDKDTHITHKNASKGPKCSK